MKNSMKKMGFVAAMILLAMGMLVTTALSEDIEATGTAPLLTEYTPGKVLVFPSAGDVAPSYDVRNEPRFLAGELATHPEDAPEEREDPVLKNIEDGANISHRNDYTTDIWWSLLDEKDRSWDKYIETPSEALKRVDNQDWVNHRLDWYYGPKGRGDEVPE